MGDGESRPPRKTLNFALVVYCRRPFSPVWPAAQSFASSYRGERPEEVDAPRARAISGKVFFGSGCAPGRSLYDKDFSCSKCVAYAFHGAEIAFSAKMVNAIACGKK